MSEPTIILTVADLEEIRKIIDIASSRGVFKTEELAFVGHHYNKLSQFLAEVQAVVEADIAASNEAAPEESNQPESN